MNGCGAGGKQGHEGGRDQGGRGRCDRGERNLREEEL